jgi:hypothetical protein
MKWTAIINDVLIWRSTELVAQEVEREINNGEPVIVRSHEAVREKKKRSLAKCMKDLSLLITPYDPDDDEILRNEDLLLEEDIVKPAKNVRKISDDEKVQKICGSSLDMQRKEIPKTAEERRIIESEKRSRREECEVQTLLNNEMTPETFDDILETN